MSTLIAEAKTRVSARRVELLEDAVKRWGEDVVEEMLRRPTALATCYACGRHTGFACTCSREEKWEATPKRVKEQFGPPNALLGGKLGDDMNVKAAAYMRRYVHKEEAKCPQCGKRERAVGRQACWACIKKGQRG